MSADVGSFFFFFVRGLQELVILFEDLRSLSVYKAGNVEIRV
jgi:hypothetical protein